MPFPLPRPLLQHGRLDVPHQDMNMVHSPHALQRHPILEPHHLVLSPRAETVYKIPLYELGHRPSALGRHIANISINRNRSAGPNDNVGDPRREPVWPVIDQHPVVGWVRKRSVRGRREWRRAPGFGQAVGQEVVGYTAILFFCLGSPLNVSPKIGRLSLEE